MWCANIRNLLVQQGGPKASTSQSRLICEAQEVRSRCVWIKVYHRRCCWHFPVDGYDDGKYDFIKNSSVYDGQAIIIETIVQKLQQVLEALSSSEIPDYNFLGSTSKLVDCATECATLIKKNAETVAKDVVHAVCGLLQLRETSLIDYLITTICTAQNRREIIPKGRLCHIKWGGELVRPGRKTAKRSSKAGRRRTRTLRRRRP